MNNAKRLHIREGTMAGGLYYMVEGSGPPLVMFNTVTPNYKNPRGIARWAARRFIKPLTQHFTVYMVGRRPGLSVGTTMADIAADYAHALADAFKGDAVIILGISTGGSIALQFAADYPELVQKLVLASTAYRLGPSAVTYNAAMRLCSPVGIYDRRSSHWHQPSLTLVSDSGSGEVPCGFSLP
jgi:pimeloyl-ACP methyl ester carboxylesterase